jgi:hypothetical protein
VTHDNSQLFVSLGNFVFDSAWNERTLDSCIARLFFEKIDRKTRIARIEIFPVRLAKSGAPAPAETLAPQVLRAKSSSAIDEVDLSWESAHKLFKTERIARGRLVDTERSFMGRSLNRHKTRETFFEGIGTCAVTLAKGSLAIREGSALIWRSDEKWWIEDFEIADPARLEKSCLVMTVWKEGSFGKTRPFWIAKNDCKIEQHFFVFMPRKGKIQALWQSSRLPRPILEFASTDLDSDGADEIVTLEGEYDGSGFAAKASPTVDASLWKWKGWGFYKEWGAPGFAPFAPRTVSIDGQTTVRLTEPVRR